MRQAFCLKMFQRVNELLQALPFFVISDGSHLLCDSVVRSDYF